MRRTDELARTLKRGPDVRLGDQGVGRALRYGHLEEGLAVKDVQCLSRDELEGLLEAAAAEERVRSEK